MFAKIFPSRIMHFLVITFFMTFLLSMKVNAQYDASVKINETEINNILNALVEAHGINFGDYTGNHGLVAWYANVDAASVNIQPNNIITLNANLALVAEIDIYLLTFPAVDHQQLSVTGHVEIQGDLQNGYKLVFIHDPITISFNGVYINDFPDNIEINLGSSLLPESIASLFTSGIPQITTNDSEIIFGFNFQGPRFYTFKNNFAGVSNGGVINVNGVQYYSPSSVEVASGGLVTATAIDQTIDGVQYIFTNWSNGSTSRSTTFNQEGTYSANFARTLSATISGPSYLGSGQSGTWATTASGGTAPYHYQWWYMHPSNMLQSFSIIRPNNIPVDTWFTLGTDSPTLSRYDSQNFNLKCVVTDATNTQVTSNIISVSVGSSLAKISGTDTEQVNDKLALAEELPTEYSMGNYPNPFNPATKINFSLPNDGHVSLKVFDILGREVAVLANQVFLAGRYEFDFNASNLPSGTYIYSLRTDNKTITKKMLLLK